MMSVVESPLDVKDDKSNRIVWTIVSTIGAVLLFGQIVTLPDVALMGYMDNIIFSSIIAIGTWLSFPKPKTALDKLVAYYGKTIDPKDVEEAIVKNLIKINELKNIIGKLDNSDEITKSVNAIVKVAETLIAGFKNNPDDIKRCKTFLRRFLDGTIEVMKKFITYADNNNSDFKDASEITDIKIKFVETLNKIEAGFVNRIKQGIKNDKLDLEVEIKVLDDLTKL